MGVDAVRWGILSTARINERVLKGAGKSDRVDVLAVASRDAARAEAYAREKGIERAHGSYEALLADPDVEAVYISLPNSLHVDWTVRALEAGKHVLCEKPLDRRPERVEEAFDAADRTGRLLMEGFMWRHHPQTAKLVELVENGAIGELRLVRTSFSFLLTRVGDVRLAAGLDGGSLLDVGCYCVSAARLLAGEPELVHGVQTLAPSGVDVRFAGTMRFDDGRVLAHFDCGFDVPYRSELEVVGPDGSVWVDDAFIIGTRRLELRRNGEVEVFEAPKINKYQLELENLSDAIRGIAEPLLGREDALGQARAADALLRSAEAGGAPVAPA
jgi:xylose dehydrogenase (NAD/NADP)